MIKIIKFFFESLIEYQSQKHQLMLLVEQRKHELRIFFAERMNEITNKNNNGKN
jgi:hypothetical protein